MVKVERNLPAPDSLAIEAMKANGSNKERDVIDSLRIVFHDKCYICELKGLQDPEALLRFYLIEDDVYVEAFDKNNEKSVLTANLITETFNLRNTGIREAECDYRIKALMAALYQVDVRTINDHIQKVYNDGELASDSTIRNFRIVQTEGNRQVQRDIMSALLKII